MNYKQQFSQILNTEFNNCAKSIHLSLNAVMDSTGAKVGLSTHKEASIYSLEDVQIFPFAPSIIHNSFFVTAYSFFEYSFRKFCEIIVTDHSQYKRKLSSMDKIYQYYSIVSNILPVKENSIAEDWEALVIFREIRNIIVHYNSIVPGNTSLKTKAFLECGDYLLPIGNGLIGIKEEMISDMLRIALRFLFNLMEAYANNYPQGVFSK
ncbi:MAG: hypothetical protein NVV82_14425 [Sporocytophaga sp.]|nr:hypothetical protein [Sporocytophaga sp.]